MLRQSASTAIGTVRARSSTMVDSTKDGAMLDRIDTLATDVHEIKSQLEGLSTSVDGRFDHVDGAIREQREYTEFAYQRIEGRIDRLETRMDARFEQIDARFDRMDERFDRMDERFDRMDQRFDRFERKLDALIGAKTSRPRPKRRR
jgi:flagellar capping protein FliD